MKYFTFLCCVVVVLCACKENKPVSYTDENGTIVVELDMSDLPDISAAIKAMDEDAIAKAKMLSKTEPLSFDELIDSVSFVKLETNDECLIEIGKIDQVTFAEERFFIPSNDIVFVFDRSGRYLCKFGQHGRGPGEFMKISKLMFDSARKRLMIYCLDSRKILYYTLDGKFLKELSLINAALFRDVINLPDGRFLCYEYYTAEKGKYPDGVWEMDSLGNMGKVYLDQNDVYPIIPGYYTHYFYELSDGGVGMWRLDLNDILHFSDTMAYTYMTMIPNKKTVADFPGTKNDTPYTNNIALYRHKVYEKGNFVITEWHSFVNGQYFCTSVYFKREDRVALTVGIENNMDIPVGEVDFNVPDQMLHVIIPDVLINSRYYASDDVKRMFSDLSISEIGEEDNPILKILYVKR